MRCSTIDKKKQGKISKSAGQRFESIVREDLVNEGWIVDRWSNNVNFSDSNINLLTEERIGKLVPSKITWRRTPKGMFPLGLNSGFPDYLAYILFKDGHFIPKIIGVESKMNGALDTEEKDKCEWLLRNNIFSRILIARKTKIKNKIVVEYEDYDEIRKRRHKHGS